MFVFLQKKMNNIKHLRQGSFWNLVDLTWNGPIARPLRQKFKHSTTYSCLRSYIHTVWTSVACCCSADVTSGKPAQSPALRHICLLTPTLHAISGRYHRGPSTHNHSCCRDPPVYSDTDHELRTPAHNLDYLLTDVSQLEEQTIKLNCVLSRTSAKLQHVWVPCFNAYRRRKSLRMRATAKCIKVNAL